MQPQPALGILRIPQGGHNLLQAAPAYLRGGWYPLPASKLTPVRVYAGFEGGRGM